MGRCPVDDPILKLKDLPLTMLSLKEELHKQYVREKGTFIIKCNAVIFTTEQLEILLRYGYWFEALCDGILKPFTEKQRRFIQAIKGEREPFNQEEVTWSMYLHRLKLEKRHGNHLEYNFIPEEEGFYREEMYKDIQAKLFTFED